MKTDEKIPLSSWTDAELVSYARRMNARRLPIYRIALGDCVSKDRPDTVEINFIARGGIKVKRISMPKLEDDA